MSSPIRILAAAAAAVAVLAAPALPAGAATSKSCTRGGARLIAAEGQTRVVRLKVKRQGTQETRREHVLACWVKTGRRTTVAREVDHGDDNRARTRVEINDGRYVGVRRHNEGGVSESIQAAVYDARTGRKRHDSAACDKVEQGDFGGVYDVAFTERGGMAMACNRLLLYRKAGSQLETIEPAGAQVRQLAVSRYSHHFGQRLFWTVGEGDGETTKSIAL